MRFLPLLLLLLKHRRGLKAGKRKREKKNADSYSFQVLLAIAESGEKR